MLRLLIVEDEDLIRQSLEHIIDWQSLGVEVVGSCRDGIEAYDTIIDENPDIVLTDIKMPGLDGLALVERVAELDLNCVFVILSGYADFSYAQKAMRYNVQFYLTKPCNEKEIAEAVQKASETVLREKRIRAILPDSLPEEEDPSDSIAHKVRQYVEQHYHDSTLSLKFVAEKVLFMNADYVGKQFFQQTGMKFSQCVTRTRIQRAKQIIARMPNARVNEIAEAVGCGHNPQYFSQMFKKETGETLSEYMHRMAEPQKAPSKPSSRTT